ncbi:hypothetical protein DENSPDRAFT_837291 [Dentipellis sp. KUC8613]|nr:hypothetical protein DENSPDRAFT_837291 [Dentipellis sp. KUC8613]
MQTRTTITRMRGQTETGLEVATLDWMLGRFLGTAHIGDREVLMGDLVDRTGAASPELRSFMSTSSDGSAVRCTWARQPDGSYQLWSSGTYLAEYQPTQEHIAGIGMSWGTMRYWFRPEQLFLDAIITVSINKWIDLQGL